MYTVYVLFSEKYNKIYIGYTSDLVDRLKSHNHLATKGYTVKFSPWEILFTEEFSTQADALWREKILKSGRGKEYIRRLISESDRAHIRRGGRQFGSDPDTPDNYARFRLFTSAYFAIK